MEMHTGRTGAEVSIETFKTLGGPCVQGAFPTQEINVDTWVSIHSPRMGRSQIPVDVSN